MILHEVNINKTKVVLHKNFKGDDINYTIKIYNTEKMEVKDVGNDYYEALKNFKEIVELNLLLEIG